MLKTKLSNTDLEVSRLCLGTANLGLKQSETEAFALLDYFVEVGGDFIDTARVYSDWIPGEKGRCERILGDWLKTRPELKDRVVIATKGAHYEWSDKSKNRVSTSFVAADIDASLRSLGVETIPLWYLHRDNLDRPVEEIVDFMQPFVESGKVRFLGVANWTVYRLSQANEYASREGLHGFVANQPGFSVGTWGMSQENKDATLANLDRLGYEFHRESGLALVPYSSQAKGFFTKLLESDGAASLEENPYYSERNLKIGEVIRELSNQHRCNANAIVLAYLLQQPFPVFPIIGAYSPSLVEDSVKSLQIELSPSEVVALRCE
ncbi:aldo/keto reductase [Pelagicoccus sp. NFK12]|uniref:Aldo/keto reductase n=1 Tax=Pelagicoccus enzymogenes TaxID=2773457 RepID=A0A927FBG3_9BACT|nr:aldo/keto reductase [Pelagicoccus enzymogenes]MBD5780650.1 aldo/keto reductase [Pelagicoccus enzymogenes]